MNPLPPHVVSLLLSYISSFDSPLPSHLLSSPLRQRVHFLGLGDVLDTAQDAAAYLSWPSPSGSDDGLLTVANLLTALPSPEDSDLLFDYPTKYSFDGEAIYAHAHVPVRDTRRGDSGGLRLVFRWEVIGDDHVGHGDGNLGLPVSAGNWKYHDVKPMPFPPNVHDSPQEALHPPITTLKENTTLTLTHSPASTQSSTNTVAQDHPEVNSDSDDDAYWDSYGQSNSDDEDGRYMHNHSRFSASKNDDDEKAEEAYWAQYATVHGTADSTRHSPLPQKRKLHDPSQPVVFQSSFDHASSLDRPASQEFLTSEAHRPELLDVYGFEHMEHLRRFSAARGRETSSDGMPCPEAIARRLHNLSPRMSPGPLPAPPEIEQQRLEDVDPLSPEVDSPDTSEERTLTPPGNIEASSIAEIALSTYPGAEKEHADCPGSVLHEAIRGIYRLWATGRDGQLGTDLAAQKSEFVEIVRDALNIA